MTDDANPLPAAGRIRAAEVSTAKLDAAAVQFHRNRGIAIYRESDGKRGRGTQDPADSG